MATKLDPDASLEELLAQFRLAASGVQAAYHQLEQELLSGAEPQQWETVVDSEGLELPNLAPLHLMGSLVAGLAKAAMVMNQDLQVVSANAEAQRLFHLDGETDLRAVVLPRVVEKFSQLINDTASVSGLEIKLQVGGAAGIFDCIYLDNPIEKGRLLLLVAQDLELDHLREVEDQILKNLTGTLVHEIRTPLTSMQGFAELLLQVQDLDPKESDKLQFIRSGIDRLNLLASALGTVFREIAEPHWIKVNINGYLQEVASGFLEGRELPAAVIELRLLEQDVQIVTDPELVREALGRVLENAVEALESPASGDITLSAQHDGAELVITITDKGPQAAGDDTTEWWVPFYTNKSGHLGLGLVQVRRIFEILGGSATIEPGQSQGMTVQLTLPL